MIFQDLGGFFGISWDFSGFFRIFGNFQDVFGFSGFLGIFQDFSDYFRSFQFFKKSLFWGVAKPLKTLQKAL